MSRKTLGPRRLSVASSIVSELSGAPRLTEEEVAGNNIYIVQSILCSYTYMDSTV